MRALPIPTDTLCDLLRAHGGGVTHLNVGVLGEHGCGYAGPTSPVVLRGIHIEATENLVGLSQPPRSHNWIGEHRGIRVDYSSHEIGHALRSLFSGNASTLECVYAPIQIIAEADLRPLRHTLRTTISKSLFAYYRRSGQAISTMPPDRPLSARHWLSAFRIALTGTHLLRSAEVILDLQRLAQHYHAPEVCELITINQRQADTVVEETARWKRLLVRLHALLEETLDSVDLPADPGGHEIVEDYLLDIRRRFFDVSAEKTKPGVQPSSGAGPLKQIKL